MKELINIIEVYPITSLPGDFSFSDIGSGSLPSHRLVSDGFSFEPQLDESSAGILYNCDKEITVDTVDNSTYKKLCIPTSAIILFRDTTGNKIFIGTKEIPAKVYLSAYLQKTKFTIKCKMLKSPY